jgi:hypothetical protein
MPLVETAFEQKRFVYKADSGLIPYDALIGSVTHDAVLDAFAQMQWQTEDYFGPDLRWLEGLDSNDIDHWVIMLPQLTAKGPRATIDGFGPTSVFRRRRRRDRGPVFGYISDRKHRTTARRIAGAVESIGDANADALHEPCTGALLIYPVVEMPDGEPIPDTLDPSGLVMAFVAVAPSSTRPPDGRLVTFTVRDREREDEAIVDTDDG